jgi:ankyrin repeat protein
MQALRESDTQTVGRALADDPKVVTRKGPGGATPLMYAALYSNAATLRRFLEAGADPNVPNDAGATALMWAAGDLEKTRLLLDRGAKVNARSDAGRTALLIAAGRMNNAAVVKALLDGGADPAVESPGLFFPMTPLAEAASTADANLVQTLIDRGADAKAAGLGPGFFALASGCAKCSELVVKPRWRRHWL